MNFKQYIGVLIFGLIVETGLILWSTFYGGSINVFIFIIALLASFVVSYKYPKRTFLIFVMFLALENIIVTPSEFPISLRAYQLLGAVLLLVTLCRCFKERKNLILGFKFLKKKDRNRKLNFLDKLVFALPVFAFLGALNSPNQMLSIKLAIVLVSYVALYLLIRSFVKNRKDIIETLLFFVFGSIPVIFWSFYQAFAKLFGWQDFQVFTARVNGTFTEPDWLGVYLTLMLAALLWFRHLAKPDKSNLMVAGFGVSQIFGFFVNLYFVIAFSVLILTVSRSAWVGVFLVYAVYFLMLFADKFFHKTVSFFQIGKNLLVLGILSFSAIFLISLTSLSTFHFGNRAASSISGQQLITISCEKHIELPTEVRNMEELDIFGCRHIDLEDVEKEKMNKMFVTTIMRPDPNVSIRKDIYGKTFFQIKEHPLLGQGLGSAASFLGTDDHGSGLNTSNIILEIFLSMGLFAMVVAVYIVSRLLLWSCSRIYSKQHHAFSSFLILSGVAIIVPNMFNAGLLMGMFWFWLAMSISIFVVVNKED